MQEIKLIIIMDVQFDKIKTLNALLYVANRVSRKDFRHRGDFPWMVATPGR